MRTLKLKEKDTDVFLRLEETENGALLVVEQGGNMVSQVQLTLKQLLNAREWMASRHNEWFNEHKVTSKGLK